MAPVGFEPTIPASARSQTYALDGAATGITRYLLQQSATSHIRTAHTDLWT
jgi:hypothetical protein